VVLEESRVTLPLLTQRDVCALLRISAKSLQRMRRERLIKFVQFGPHSIRFRQEDVGEFIRRRERREA
jgi:excisionase family DNA binding protein